METNDLVNEFLLDKFRKEAKQRFRIGVGKNDERPGYDKEKHLSRCDTLQVSNVECSIECGCYSCYTRDDSFEMTAHVGCDCGVEMRWVYGYMWDLPDFITELDEYKNMERDCYHENDCEECREFYS